MNVKTEAIDQVEKNANEQWISTALFIISYLTKERNHFTTDTIWAEFVHYPTIKTHEPRAMGAVMRKAKVIGLVSSTPNFVNSNRTSCHYGPKRIWKSNYDETTGTYIK